jgi:replicative DNA helicase
MGAWWADLQRRFDQKQRMTGLLTPFTDLNEVTLGLQPGDLIIVAARPSMGKTVFGCEVASYNALDGGNTALFSLEMRHEAILQRLVAAQARVQHKHLRAPSDLLEEEWPRVADATTKIGAAPLYIDDQRSLTATQIVARAKRQHLRQPLTLIVVDHLHEIRLPGKDRVNEIGDAVRQLKDMAYQLHVPVVLLVQLNRGLTQRADHRPTLADLRGSGSIEEIADIVLLLHREEMHDHTTHLKGVIELILGKGRDLPAGDTIWLKNVYSQMRMENWSAEDAVPTRSAPRASKKKGNGLSAPPAFNESAER